MLPLGQLGSRQTAFTHNQQVTILTLWSILPAPLIFGGETTALANDAWTTALLTNEEVLAVDQDAAGIEAKRIAQQGTTEVWARDLSLGRKAVALFNHATQDAIVSVTFSQLGVTGQPVVRDLWHRADVTGMTTGISAMVPHESAFLYTLSPPGGAGGAGGGGTGGVGGGMATGGHAGAAATGGSPGTGGSVGTGGTIGTGGSTSGGTGGSAPGAGGTPGTGGSATGAGGTPGTGGSAAGAGGSGETGSSSGCSCALAAGGRNPATLGIGFLIAGLILAARRRRVR
jgi:MYXO-CTERM domain-containing protein